MSMRYEYDDGRLIAATHPDGTVVRYRYDDAGNLVSRTVEAGRPTDPPAN